MTEVVPVTLATATTIQQLIDLGVHQAITVWAEWGPTFIPPLDKGTENRPGKPPKTIIGKRVAFHNGAYIGGRKGATASLKGIQAMLRTAEYAGWRFTGTPPSRGERGRRGRDRRSYNDVNLGRGILSKGDAAVDFDGSCIVTSAITFTAIITGYEEPTEMPTRPWQSGSDLEDPDDRSYGWHVEHVVPLMTPIPCAGIQGFWPLARLLKP